MFFVLFLKQVFQNCAYFDVEDDVISEYVVPTNILTVGEVRTSPQKQRVSVRGTVVNVSLSCMQF